MTVQRKQIAKGTQISIGTVASATVALYGRIETFQSPTLDYESVVVPELNPQDDAGNPLAADPEELGDEVFDQFTFTHYWDARHVDATNLDTWWAAKEELIFQEDSSHATGGARRTYNGRIKSLSPSQYVKGDYYKRTVTIVRTSSITTADIPVVP